MDLETDRAPGWLREIVIDMPEDVQNELDELDRAGRTSRYWHTWLTGIYHAYSVPADVWYAGGPLKDAVKHLRLRERPDVASSTISDVDARSPDSTR